MLTTEINALDLEPIIVKLMDKDEGKGWSLEFAVSAAQEYKKFLMLCYMYPEEAIVPSDVVDDFWHYHILDTQKYFDDCDAVFGSYLHHFPYFGMRGDSDAKNLSNAWQSSCGLYAKHFGDMPASLWNSHGRCPNCGRRCSKDNAKYMFDARPRLSANDHMIMLKIAG